MTDQQKQYVLRGALALLAVCMVAWLIMLFWPKSPAPENKPSIVEAGRPQYNYNDSSYIQQNPEMFLTQILPLLGNLEGAAQRGDMAAVPPAATILRKELVRWHDATGATVLREPIQSYIDAVDAAVAAANKNDKAALAKALGTLQEIKTLALSSNRSTLQSSLLQ